MSIARTCFSKTFCGRWKGWLAVLQGKTLRFKIGDVIYHYHHHHPPPTTTAAAATEAADTSVGALGTYWQPHKFSSVTHIRWVMSSISRPPLLLLLTSVPDPHLGWVDLRFQVNGIIVKLTSMRKRAYDHTRARYPPPLSPTSPPPPHY